MKAENIFRRMREVPQLKKAQSFTMAMVFLVILGMALGEVLPDPMDWIYYWLQANGYLADPWMATFVWYFMDALFWCAVAGIVYLAWKANLVKPRTVIHILMLMTVIGAGLTVMVVNPMLPDAPQQILFVIVAAALAMLTLLYLDGYRISFRRK